MPGRAAGHDPGAQRVPVRGRVADGSTGGPPSGSEPPARAVARHGQLPARRGRACTADGAGAGASMPGPIPRCSTSRIHGHAAVRLSGERAVRGHGRVGHGIPAAVPDWVPGAGHAGPRPAARRTRRDARPRRRRRDGPRWRRGHGSPRTAGRRAGRSRRAHGQPAPQHARSCSTTATASSCPTTSRRLEAARAAFAARQAARVQRPQAAIAELGESIARLLPVVRPCSRGAGGCGGGARRARGVLTDAVGVAAGGGAVPRRWCGGRGRRIDGQWRRRRTATASSRP
jgi:hypothetical protein